ncbi:MAG: glycosyltransferase family 2 protein [Flavobacteriales bacterium]|nr:glycosyltransferase family 2 protein [Flavobacteriales bacterium]
MKVAVAILNYNGKHWLEKFLPNVISNSLDAEVVIIDNASTDDSVQYIRDQFPNLKLIINQKNSGFAGGYNEGLKKIESDIYILLNSDIEVTPNWIQPILELFRSDKNIAAIQPKILSYNDKTRFEHAGASGGYIDKLGYPFCRGRIFTETEIDENQYNSAQPIFWATGACLFIRSEQYWEAGGLDEDFFAHMEEIDLCWRLQNMGFQIYVEPKSYVYHVGGGTLDYRNPRKTYLNFRNSLYAIHKNWSRGLFFIIFSRLVLDGIAGLKFLIGGDFKHISSIIKAHFHYYGHIGKLKKQRKELKKNNKNILQLKGVLNASIVWKFYLKGKKSFRDLNL